jgi:hypothetical protein
VRRQRPSASACPTTHRPLVFGGVAYKYTPALHHRQDDDDDDERGHQPESCRRLLHHAAALTAHFCDVVVTSGPGTGRPCPVGKLASLHSSGGGWWRLGPRGRSCRGDGGDGGGGAGASGDGSVDRNSVTPRLGGRWPLAFSGWSDTGTGSGSGSGTVSGTGSGSSSSSSSKDDYLPYLQPGAVLAATALGEDGPQGFLELDSGKVRKWVSTWRGE